MDVFKSIIDFVSASGDCDWTHFIASISSFICKLTPEDVTDSLCVILYNNQIIN